MAKFELISGEESHVRSLVGRLRISDMFELHRLNGNDAHMEMIDSWKKSDERYLIVYGHPIGVTGVTKGPNHGIPWMLGSCELEDVKKSLVQHGRRLSQKWLEKYGVLCNYVDADNEDSHKFIKGCGYQFLAPIPLGPYKHPFIPFYMR